MPDFFDDGIVLCGAILALVFVFLCICVVCDKHLVPAVETIIEEFDVPEEIAAVTLIAFGSSSPEIMLNTVSAFEGSGALSMPAMLGSAIIAFGLVPPLCVLSTSKENVDLETRPILRETFSFTMGLCLFTKIVADGSANLVESLLILSLYFMYVLVIIVTYYCYKTSDHEPQHHSHSSRNGDVSSIEAATPLIELTSAGLISDNSDDNDNDDSGDRNSHANATSKKESLEKCCLHLCNCVSFPLVAFFHCATPALFDSAICREPLSTTSQLNSTFPGAEQHYGHSPYCCHTQKVTLFRALSVVIVSIGYVCVFASIVVELCGIITIHGGFDQTTVGATLVAFGAQLPDIVSSISLARDGYFNGAMANAVGSQV